MDKYDKIKKISIWICGFALIGALISLIGMIWVPGYFGIKLFLVHVSCFCDSNDPLYSNDSF